MSEAHAKDEWILYKDVCFNQPRTLEERVAVATEFGSRVHPEIPMVIDSMENTAEMVFAAWPERLYVIGEDRRIAYKGALGPDGYRPEEVATWLQAKFPSCESKRS